MANIEGIDRITYGVDDLAACSRFFLDWGLTLVRETADSLDFETLKGSGVFVCKGLTLRPRDFEPRPEIFAERAIAGGLDGNTRRQKMPEKAGP
jgi:hypothetical protein